MNGRPSPQSSHAEARPRSYRPRLVKDAQFSSPPRSLHGCCRCGLTTCAEVVSIKEKKDDQQFTLLIASSVFAEMEMQQPRPSSDQTLERLPSLAECLKRPLSPYPMFPDQHIGVRAEEPVRNNKSTVSIDDPDVRLAAQALGDLRAGVCY